jgi:hypothetical protein
MEPMTMLAGVLVAGLVFSAGLRWLRLKTLTSRLFVRE